MRKRNTGASKREGGRLLFLSTDRRPHLAVLYLHPLLPSSLLPL